MTDEPESASGPESKAPAKSVASGSPSTIGRFVVDTLQSQPTAIVARDPSLGRDVMLRPLARAPEASAPPAADGFATLHEVVRDGDRAYAVFEHVAGTSLLACSAVRRTRALRDARAALDALHAAGRAHGRLTAAAIVVDSTTGRTMILDLGLAALDGTVPSAAEDRAAFSTIAAAAKPTSWLVTIIAISVIVAISGFVGAMIVIDQDDHDRRSPSETPLLTPTASSTSAAHSLGALGGCSADPVFVDASTVAFSHTGAQKPGIYTTTLDDLPPHWIWDGPLRERALAPAGIANKILFLTDHVEQLDVVAAGHMDLKPKIDYFLSPFLVGISGIASPDAFYYVALAGQSLYRFEAGTATELATLPAGEIIYQIAVSPDGKLVSLSASRGLYIVDVTAKPPKLERLATEQTAYHHAPIAPGGRYVYYPNAAGVSRYDRTARTEALIIPNASAAGGLAMSPDGKHLVGSACQTVATVAVDNAELFREAIDWPAIAADGSWLYALRLPSGPVAARRFPDGRVVQLSKPTLGQALTPTLSPDGKQVAFAIDGIAPGIYVTASDGSGEPALVAKDGGHYPRWLPDGRLAFARPDETGGTRLFAIPKGGGEPVSIHPRSRRIADVIAKTGEVLIVDGNFTHLWRWNPATGAETAVTLSAALDPEALALVRASPDGTSALVTTGLLNTIWRVDLTNKTPPEKLREGEIEAFAGAVYLLDGRIAIATNTPSGSLWTARVAE